MADKPITEPIDEPIDTPIDEPIDEPLDSVAKLEQQTKSWLGRLEAGQKEDRATQKQIVDTLTNINERLEQRPQPQSPAQNNNVISDLNEKWHSKMLEGDIVGVLDERDALLRQAQDENSRSDKIKVDKFVATLSEQPLFADIKDNVQKLAHDLVTKGYTPQDAVSYSFEKNRADYMGGLLATLNTQNPAALEMLKGGKGGGAGGGNDAGKLPDRFEKAYQADKAKGYFKNREEYIAALAPQIRKELNI